MDIHQIGSTASAALPERKPAPPPKAASVMLPELVKEQEKPNPKQLAEALKSINTVLQVRSPDLEFSVDSESARTIVKVVDTKTHEVIRQMPSEEALQIAKALEHLESLLIRDKA